MRSDPGIVAWFIARTKAQREVYAQENLEIRRLDVFLPRVIEVDFENRNIPRRRPAPLFPGYLFVKMNFPLDYYRVIWTPGVRDLVALGSGPVPIGDAVVESIRCRCDNSGVVRLPPAPWSPGDRVEIPSGPFAGLLATVVSVMPRRRRVKLLIDFLAQQTPVEMPLTALKVSRMAMATVRPGGAVQARS
jgi:transcriptional antiterminator RfaH